MKRHGYLFEQVVAWANLLSATKNAARGKKDQPKVARFLFDLEPELLTLQQDLETGSWQPRPYHTFHIRDPKPRHICEADFRDRVVHHAAMDVLDPIFERALIAHTYACRVGKGTHAAVRYAQKQARRYPYVLKGDVDRYFETIDHGVLKALLLRIFKDARLLELLDRIIDAPVPGLEPGIGLPIGNLTSQYFANHFLGQLDQFVKRELRVRGYIRYMDDILLFGTSKPKLHRDRAAIRTYLADELHLHLKEEATWVAPTTHGIPFLGFRIFPGVVRLQRKRLRRTRRKIRRREKDYREGRISTDDLAESVRSSIAHIEHASTYRLRRSLFEESHDLG